MAVLTAGCDQAPVPVEPIYDQFTSKLIALRADQNGDGSIDQWTYMDGNRPLRGEADTDGDGRIDRWEYFDGDGQLASVGASSLGDGVEDVWSFVAPINGTHRVARSRRRDRQIDRNEYVDDQGTLVRVEEDANGDGVTDKWERYEGKFVREVSFDTTQRAGRPNRRLLYDGAGQFTALEGDLEGKGVWTPMRADEATLSQAGVRK